MLKKIIIKKIILLSILNLVLVFLSCNSVSSNTKNVIGNYKGYKNETQLEYQLLKAHKFKFLTTGHYGEILIDGDYKVIGDTIYLNPNYPNKEVNRDGVLKEELILDKQKECLQDFDLQAYCKDLEYSYRKTLQLENALNEIEEEFVEIDLEYFGLMCPCPQWATPENVALYNKSLGSENPIPMDSLFMILEPENEETIHPFDLEGWDEQNSIIFSFSGRFYKRKHYWVGEDGSYWYCRKFRYTDCDLKKR